jgi:23S rRNA pseudouridine2605 synthase
VSEELTQERLQKALAFAGVASRRQAEQLIAAGRVAVNDRVVTELGTKVGPRDRIAVDGKPIDRVPHLQYILLNKPVAVLSTARDERGRPTVVDLVKSSERVYPVGRLDVDSEGLLLLTNDGELTFRLLHPRHEIPREYHVWVTPAPSEQQLATLQAGVEIDGWRTGPATIRRRPGGALSFVIHEGHKRQIRLMAQAVGLHVTRLVRIRMGPLGLGAIKPGEWRELRAEEVDALRREAGLASSHAPAKRPTTERRPSANRSRNPISARSK